jgi:hypothetical protein
MKVKTFQRPFILFASGVESGDEKNIHFVATLKIKFDLAKNRQLAKIHQEIEPLLVPVVSQLAL